MRAAACHETEEGHRDGCEHHRHEIADEGGAQRRQGEELNPEIGGRCQLEPQAQHAGDAAVAALATPRGVDARRAVLWYRLAVLELDQLPPGPPFLARAE